MSNVGSLTQSARKETLGSVRGILYFIGILSLAMNAFMFMNAEKEVEKALNAEIQKIVQPGMVLDPQVIAEAKATMLQMVRLIYGGGVALGGCFVVLGALIYKKPVPIVIAALVLYIGGNAVFGFIDPTSLVRGIIIKVIIVVSLVKAIGTASAYEKERSSVPTPDPA